MVVGKQDGQGGGDIYTAATALSRVPFTSEWPCDTLDGASQLLTFGFLLDLSEGLVLYERAEVLILPIRYP